MKTTALSSAVISLFLAAAPFSGAQDSPAPKAEAASKAAAVPFEDLQAADSFQSFVQNWDDAKTPVLCALIRNVKDWDSVMHPAPVGGGNKPFGPKEGFYDSKQILLVARVVAGEGLLKPAQVTLGEDGVLTFAYTLASPVKKLSYTMKWPLAVSIPKDTKFKTVVFVENGKEVGRPK